MSDLTAIKQEVAETMRRLVRRGLTTTTGGNVSARAPSGEICITPSQIDKEFISDEQIGLICTDGVILLAEGLKLSLETAMHQTIYSRRPDVTAIVHAHPPWATSFTAAPPERLRTDLIAETWALIGNPVSVSYALMGSRELADKVGDSVGRGDVLLLKNHGVIAVGGSLWQAYSRLEALEEAAKMTLICSLAGGQRGLNGAQKRAIDLMMGRKNFSY